jgi:hypothetical protein
LPIAEAFQLQTEQEEHGEERLDSPVAKAQGRNTLLVDGGGGLVLPRKRGRLERSGSVG